MKDTMLREQKDRVLAPLAERFLAGVSPMSLTVTAVGVGLLSAAAVIGGYLWIGLALWLLNRALDGLDGLVARVHSKKSDLGGYFDLMLDFVIYLAVPISFVIATPSLDRIWALVFLLGTYQINTLSWTLLSAILEKRRLASASSRLTSIEMPAGLIEGAETVVFYSLFFLLPGYITYLFVIMGALVIVTVVQRVWWAHKYL